MGIFPLVREDVPHPEEYLGGLFLWLLTSEDYFPLCLTLKYSSQDKLGAKYSHPKKAFVFQSTNISISPAMTTIQLCLAVGKEVRTLNFWFYLEKGVEPGVGSEFLPL